MGVIAESSIEEELCKQIRAVASAGGQVEIGGGGSKRFYGEAVEALPIDVSEHSGVVDYDPAELVITLRAGCRLAEVEALLAEKQQMFGFEPPAFGEDATIGGTIAAGLAGPRRAFAGAVRDFVLGVRMIDGRGQVLSFGGRVIKNVAGFDVSRLLAGSLGTLGVILEVSIRVVPVAERETTLAFEHRTAGEHIRWINGLGSRPWPLSASLWHDGTSRLRLSGSEQGVRHAVAQLGGDEVEFDWPAIREQRHDFFDRELPLTRVTLPPTHADLPVDLPQMIEWGGAERWFSGNANLADIRAGLDSAGASVCAFRGHPQGSGVFHPLPEAMLRLQRSIKSSFDPAGIFNPGRLYPRL